MKKSFFAHPSLRRQAPLSLPGFTAYTPYNHLCLFLLFAIYSLSLTAQVTANQVDQIASHILTVNRINLRGEIRADAYRASGFAATFGNANYSIIYVDPYKLRTLSPNTWAFIVSHELAHQYLRHSPLSQSIANELEADRVGAYWAWQAGYNVNAYLDYMATEPDICTPTHGCWHDRIRNIMAMFGLAYSGQCR